MDLAYSPEELTFRDDVAEFVQTSLPRAIADKVSQGKPLTKADMDAWHAILNARGWLANQWPVDHGGAGWNAVQRHIFEEQCCAANAPRVIPFGVTMLGPVLLKYGTAEQQAHYLPRILDGTDWWCQGYSEPGSGSDLASLKTRAIVDGDHYLVSGQKTWTTLGQYADWMFLLVRTDTHCKPQQGISFLLMDMTSPGVEVRPIVTLDGGSEINEVFIDAVRVPLANRVGEENQGWTIAKYLLTHERTNVAGVGFSTSALVHLKSIAARQMKRGRPLARDPYFAARMARLEIDLDAMRTTNLRMLSAVAKGAAPGFESSMLKIKGTEIRLEINDLARRALGPYAMPFVSEALEAGYNDPPIGPEYANPIASQYFNNRKQPIYGGSNEIQKNIIAKSILGL
jgi:alkylation response protein AidB-like acyl-CoA dehydrogenase